MTLFLHHQVAPEREVRPNADWSWGRFDSTFLCEEETGKTTGKTKITGETATNVYVSLDFFVHFENEQNLGLPHLNFQHHKLQLVWPRGPRVRWHGAALSFLDTLPSKSKWNWKHGHFGIHDSWPFDVFWNTCGNIIFIHFQSWNASSSFWAHIGKQLTPLISVVKQPRLYWKCGNASVPFVQNIWLVIVDGFSFEFGTTLQMCVVHICSFSRDG